MRTLETVVHKLFSFEHLHCPGSTDDCGAMMLMDTVNEQEGYIEYKCPYCDAFVMRLWFYEEVQ